MRRFSAPGLVSLLLVLASASFAQSGDLAAIQQKLNSQFKVTTTTADHTDIVTAGDVVVLHKAGLIMFGVTDVTVPAGNSYRNGRLGQGLKTVLISANPNNLTRTFAAEEKCWVTGIRVEKDGVRFSLYSDPYSNGRFYADLKILFPEKKAVPPVDSFLKTISEVLTVMPPDDQDGQQQAPPPPARSSRNGGRDFSLAPAPPAPPTATISLGQTMNEVTVAFGDPLRKASVGTKDIFIYKDMKVTFLDGKVTNVE
jgi:hypothetical protein